ncbi:MAG: hypothetical protein H6932_05050 [Burkholderiaceae bacterium]|nr:hypothetical protein [Burkholderiaceae bacterium]
MEFRVATKAADAARNLQVSLIDTLPFIAGGGPAARYPTWIKVSPEVAGFSPIIHRLC